MKVTDTAEFALFEVPRIKPRLMFGGERTVEDEIERALAFARDRLARLDSRMSDAYHLFNGRIDGYNIDLDSLVDTDYGLAVTVPTAAGTPGKIGVDAAVLAPLLDHGLLAGKGDDDHTQYLLVDGSRASTGEQEFKAGLNLTTAGALKHRRMTQEEASAYALPTHGMVFTIDRPSLELRA